MTRGLIIPALPFLPLIEQEFAGLADYQAAVHGYIEPVTIRNPLMTLYINEEGKQRELTPNFRATALWWLLEPEARGLDVLIGPSVLVADEEDPTAAPFLAQLTRERRFQVEVRTAEVVGSWTPAPHFFPTWFDAAIQALRLVQDWQGVQDVRVTPA